MMLARTASSLYWMGRYVERADFTARLIEATVRLDALSSRPAGTAAWASALAVIEATAAFEALGKPVTQRNVVLFLASSPDYPGSMVGSIGQARSNARAVRTALSREAWSAVNNAWLLFQTVSQTSAIPTLLRLVEQVQADTLAFTGALERMLHHPWSMFIRLGAAIERADNTARLIDVKYHILLPEGEQVGGAIDRDQWTTILHTVGAVNAYRFIYSGGLDAINVVEFLTLRRELPRALVSSAAEVVKQLQDISDVTGHFGAADSMARTRLANMQRSRISEIIGEGLHEYLEDFIIHNAMIDQAISRQFRF